MVQGDDWFSDRQLAIFHDCDCCIVLCCVLALLQYDEGICKECLYSFYREGLQVVVVQCSLVVADRCGIVSVSYTHLRAHETKALCSNLFNTVRGATAAYFFKDYIGDSIFLNLGDFTILFYAGLFLGVGEVSNMIGVVLAVPLSRGLGKKSTYIFTMAALAVLSILFFYLPCTPFGFWLMLIMQIIISICTGIVSPLIWSMYADVSDYAELKDGTASTGLIFSSSSMAQKFGGAFGGAAVMWILASFGYNTAEGAVQTAEALTGLNLLMSWIPAAVAVVAMIVVYFYPLTKKRVEEINKGLKKVRASD